MSGCSYVMARCDRYGNKMIAYVEMIDELKKADHPMLVSCMPHTRDLKLCQLMHRAEGPSPEARHREALDTIRSRHRGTSCCGLSYG